MEDEVNNLILIVDDNPHNIQVLAAVINECNYESGFAMNGQQALDFLEENIPALILLDIMMPDMNGYEVCEKIKEKDHLKDIPIIFITAKSEKDDIVKGFEVGGVDYVTKPFNNMELKMRIKTHIELSQSKNSLITLNKKLEKANDTKDKFFSIIAHDLRGPIGSMNQYLELIMEDIDQNNTLFDDLKTLKDLSKNSYELLETLLLWASSQKGTIDYNPQLNDLYSLVQNNVDLFKQVADKKQISLKNELTEETKAFFDYNMINTVVRNLINNAIKYTNLNGNIIVSANQNAKNIEIIVSDDGVGMAQNTADGIFKIDVKKYSKQGTSGETGSGLGLVLCKEFIDKHNGTISVESELGKGSKFKFTISKNKSIF
ncbi:MAG: hybrid sensor histidine kinase/response regulator [Candidatus Sericytochromatia bacterium]